jgi:LacI family transcriptional regulator
MDPRRPTTLADIARELGITPAAVSKALRGALDISVETRQRVADKAREMNYRVNLTARALSSRSTKLIGVVVPTFLHSFYGDVLTAASAVLDPRDYQTIITCSDEDPEQEARQIDVLLSRQAEGLLVATCQLDDRYGVFARTRDLGVPVVLCGRNIDPPINAWVGSDNVSVGQRATRHLIEAGRRRIAHVYGPPNSTSNLRIAGYRQALEAASLPVRDSYIRGGSENDPVAEQAMRELLALDEPPDAIFCYNDAVAAACMRVIMAAGLTMPDDIALIGVGNIRFSDVMRSPLTTIDQCSARIGEVAATNLLSYIDTGREPGLIYIPGDLIVRESCGIVRESCGAGQAHPLVLATHTEP